MNKGTSTYTTMDKKLTKEQYEKLKPYDKNLIAAYKQSFVHMADADFRVVAEIYKEVFATALNPAQMRCNTCRLNALRKLGELYDKYGKEKKAQKPRKQKLEKDEA